MELTLVWGLKLKAVVVVILFLICVKGMMSVKEKIGIYRPSDDDPTTAPEKGYNTPEVLQHLC